jgi:hypothetical protein
MSGGFQAIGQAVRRFMSLQKSQGRKKVKRPKWGIGWCPVCEKMVEALCWNSLVCRYHCAETGGCDECRSRPKV